MIPMENIYTGASWLLLGICVVTLIAALIHCWNHPTLTAGKKIAWSLFMILTSWAITAGALVYGMVHYKPWCKALPVILVILLSVFTLSLANNNARLPYDIVSRMVEKEIEKLVDDPAVKTGLLGDLTALKNEVTADPKVTDRNLALIQFLQVTLKGGMDDNDEKLWAQMFGNRTELNAEKIRESAQAYRYFSRHKKQQEELLQEGAQ